MGRHILGRAEKSDAEERVVAEGSQEERDRKTAAGYVSVPGGPTCSNCEYLRGEVCVHPDIVMQGGGLVRFMFRVPEPEKDCCTFWEANDEVKEQTVDFVADARKRIEGKEDDDE